MLDERDCAIFVKYSLNLLAITSSPSTFSPLIYISSIDVFTSLGLRIDLMTCQVFFRSLPCFGNSEAYKSFSDRILRALNLFLYTINFCLFASVGFLRNLRYSLDLILQDLSRPCVIQGCLYDRRLCLGRGGNRGNAMLYADLIWLTNEL